MAYIVMAYPVMTYVVMAYIVMAYPVMTYIVMALHRRSDPDKYIWYAWVYQLVLLMVRARISRYRIRCWSGQTHMGINLDSCLQGLL